MEINSNLCSNAVRKIALLITKASDLGMDISGSGVASENQTSGNVYLWLEDYSFTLYIGLGSDTVYASWTNWDNGDEEDLEVTHSEDLNSLYNWTQALEAGVQS